ncbi:response regulator [Rhodobacterales bacterium HKCCSP123]|nr:response regulator [Rhodobacterales bacterium HKCCSP123]
MRDTDPREPLNEALGRAPAMAETLQLFSHDIRSAMSDVIGGLRLVDRDRLAPEARLQIDRVQAAADTLAALVDGALLAAAGETLIQLDQCSFALEDLLAAHERRWSGHAQEVGGAFRLDRAGPLPNRVQANQVMLDRIIGNLVSNALRHAPSAPVTLRVRADRERGLELTVRDDGPGYPPVVLDRFARGIDPPASGQWAGSGLGLRIAAELSLQAGATLELRNRTGGGGEGRLTLPSRVLDWDGAGPEPGEIPDLSGLRILVAEDNLTNQTILRQLLGQMQADAVFVADGISALERLEQDRFDIALIDIEMPRLSGLEVMQAVRRRSDAVARMPLVALTAYVLRDNREAIYDAGADGILGKPISSGREFGRAILRYAGRPAGLPEPEDVLSGLSGATQFGRKLDVARFEALLEIAGPDGCAELLSRLHDDLSTVRAVLDSAIRDTVLSEIRAQTHILIAISGAVGAERLHRLAEVLNIAAKRRRMADLPALYQPCRADLADLIAHVEASGALCGIRLGTG